MRKSLTLSLLFTGAVSALAATAVAAPQGGPKCPVYDKDDKGVVKAQTAAPMANCWADEIFVLDGKEAPVSCFVDAMTMKEDPKNCVLGEIANPYSGAGTEAAALKAIEKIGAAGAQWDQVVVFTADFGQADNTNWDDTGPLFYRTLNAADMNRPVNEVAGIGLDMVARDPAKPFIGVINAGNLKGAGATPWTGSFGPCGRNASVCASGMFSYFDALAQATGNLYGPYLKDPTEMVPPPATAPPGTAPTTRLIHGGNIVSAPAGKNMLLNFAMNATTTKVAMGLPPVTTTWNALLNLPGSVLGGNTWRDNGNATFAVVRPPAFQGVSAPFEGGQVVRFHPIDLYVMGFIPASEVGTVQSFMAATAGQFYQPQATGFSATLGPFMGTRNSGVALRTSSGVPKNVNFNDYVAPNGERVPNSDAPGTQRIRQLWVLVTNPKVTAAGDFKEQANEIELLQRFRQEYNRYFYTLTGYRGRVHTGFDGNVDDSGYFEFGDKRDDVKDYAAQGGLTLSINGPEGVPNSGGRQQTVLRVNTPGDSGKFSYNKDSRPIKISGDLGEIPADYTTTKVGTDKSRPAANNLLTVRMRIPPDPGLLAELKDKKTDFFAEIEFTGSKNAKLRIPSDQDSFLVPDGRWRNYAVDLARNPDFVGGEYNGFTFMPSNQQYDGIEIEYIKVSNTLWSNLKDSDLDCKGDSVGDGHPDIEDNCKAVFNPGQEDGNGDGVGDDCEDYDGDNVVNRCDNCPTVTNSSQRRSNNSDPRGDACNGTKSSDCFFQSSAVGGPVPPSSAIVWVAVLALGGLTVNAIRRRRRR